MDLNNFELAENLEVCEEGAQKGPAGPASLSSGFDIGICTLCNILYSKWVN